MESRTSLDVPVPACGGELGGARATGGICAGTCCKCSTSAGRCFALTRQPVPAPAPAPLCGTVQRAGRPESAGPSTRRRARARDGHQGERCAPLTCCVGVSPRLPCHGAGSGAGKPPLRPRVGAARCRLAAPPRRCVGAPGCTWRRVGGRAQRARHGRCWCRKFASCGDPGHDRIAKNTRDAKSHGGRE